MSSIKNVVNEPIEGHEEYHMIVSFYLNRTYILGILHAPINYLWH